MAIPPVMEHKDAPLLQRHGPINWYFADAAARTAYIPSLVVADVGKWAYQNDTEQVWEVAGTTGSLHWRQIGSGSGDKNLTFVQGSASAVWTIDHNLGKYPSVTTIDSGGSEVKGDVTYPTLNRAVVTFSTAFSGTASLN